MPSLAGRKTGEDTNLCISESSLSVGLCASKSPFTRHCACDFRCVSVEMKTNSWLCFVLRNVVLTEDLVAVTVIDNNWLCIVTGSTDLVQGYSLAFRIVKKFSENRPLFRSWTRTVKVNTVNHRFYVVAGFTYIYFVPSRTHNIFYVYRNLTPFPNLQVILRALIMEV